MSKAERFARIRALIERVSGMGAGKKPLVSEVTQPAVDQGLVNIAVAQIDISNSASPELSRQERRRREKLQYELEHSYGGNTQSRDGKRRREKKRPGQIGLKYETQNQAENHEPEQSTLNNEIQNLVRNAKKEKKKKLSVRELTDYALEKGFKIKRESNGHIILFDQNGITIGYNKRPNTLSAGLYGDVMKKIERSISLSKEKDNNHDRLAK